MHDLKFAFRQLAKTPVISAIAVIALALGIGANTAIFSVINGVLLRPLPFPEQERLVIVTEWSEQVPNMSLSWPNFVDFRAQQQSFSAMGASRNQGFNFATREGSEWVTGVMATHDLFAALGTRPLFGRVFTAAEDEVGAERTVVVSERFWRQRLGARSDVLGEKITLNDSVFTVIGVMPAAFQYPNVNAELWVPLGTYAASYSGRGNHPGLIGVGRLRDGVSYEQAVADLRGVAERLALQYPDSNARQSASLQTLNERAFGRIFPALMVVFGAAGCVLLIACANVANLQLARAHARGREFSVRAALGAGRRQIIRQLLVESTLLGGLGCVVGVGLGYAGLSGLKGILPANIPRVAEVGLDGGVLVFAAVVSLLTNIGFGLVPALHAAKTDLREALNQGTRGSSYSKTSWRSALIVTEFALTSLLLVCAGLMLRTMDKLQGADAGYTTQGLLTFQWMLPALPPGGETAPRIARLEAAIEKLKTLPGIGSVAVVSTLPLSGANNQNTYTIEEKPDPEQGKAPSTEVAIVNPDYFATMGIQVLKGRTFSNEDHKDSRRVALVDTEFVTKNFAPGIDPIGKRFSYGRRPEKAEDWFEIIGVVEHIQNYGLGQPTREQTYTSHRQRTTNVMSIVIRTNTAPEMQAEAVRRAMREVSPDLPIVGMRTMDELFNQSIGTQRTTVLLLGAFAGLALVLAAVGLYGVINYTVTLRTREIGVRMALGAEPGQVLRHVLRQGVWLTALGLGVGLIAALFVSQLMTSVLYEVSPFDGLSFAAVALILATIGLAACVVPARRATRIDPMVALRAE